MQKKTFWLIILGKKEPKKSSIFLHTLLKGYNNNLCDDIISVAGNEKSIPQPFITKECVKRLQ